MTSARTCLLLGPVMVLAGVILMTIFVPRARAAADNDRSPATHQLWTCVTTASCRPVGNPKGKTACLLDAAAEANVLPKGARVSCQRIVKP